MGLPTLINGFYKPKIEFGVANHHIRILPTQVQVWGGELGFGNLGYGWQTLIYGFCRAKFQFGMANLGLEPWVWGGQPSYTDFANPSSSLGWQTLDWNLGFWMANPLIQFHQPKFNFGVAKLGLGWPTLKCGFLQPKFEFEVANLGLET